MHQRLAAIGQLMPCQLPFVDLNIWMIKIFFMPLHHSCDGYGKHDVQPIIWRLLGADVAMTTLKCMLALAIAAVIIAKLIRPVYSAPRPLLMVPERTTSLSRISLYAYTAFDQLRRSIRAVTLLSSAKTWEIHEFEDHHDIVQGCDC